MCRTGTHENFTLAEVKRGLKLYEEEGEDLETKMPAVEAQVEVEDRSQTSVPHSVGESSSSGSSSMIARDATIPYPQRETGGTLVTVKDGEYGPVADESGGEEEESQEIEKEAKVMPSKKRRREKKKEIAERQAARKQRKIEEQKDAEHRIAEAEARIWPHKCNECGRIFKAECFMDKHTCKVGRTISDRVVISSNASILPSSGPVLVGFDNVVPLDSRTFRRILIGHGLRVGRDPNPLNPVVKKILMEAYLCGVERQGERRSVFEMQQLCLERLPSLLCPDIAEVQRWLSGQLQQENKTGKSSTEDEEGGDDDEDEVQNLGKKRLTRAEKEQRDAGKISNELRNRRSDDDEVAGMRFESKYMGKLLKLDENDDEIRMVVAIKYDETRGDGCWYAEARVAHQDEIDDRKFIVDASRSDYRRVYVGSTRENGSLSKCIKYITVCFRVWVGTALCHCTMYIYFDLQ